MGFRTFTLLLTFLVAATAHADEKKDLELLQKHLNRTEARLEDLKSSVKTYKEDTGYAIRWTMSVAGWTWPMPHQHHLEVKEAEAALARAKDALAKQNLQALGQALQEAEARTRLAKNFYDGYRLGNIDSAETTTIGLCTVRNSAIAFEIAAGSFLTLGFGAALAGGLGTSAAVHTAGGTAYYEYSNSPEVIRGKFARTGEHSSSVSQLKNKPSVLPSSTPLAAAPSGIPAAKAPTDKEINAAIEKHKAALVRFEKFIGESKASKKGKTISGSGSGKIDEKGKGEEVTEEDVTGKPKPKPTVSLTKKLEASKELKKILELVRAPAQVSTLVPAAAPSNVPSPRKTREQLITEAQAVLLAHKEGRAIDFNFGEFMLGVEALASDPPMSDEVYTSMVEKLRKYQSDYQELLKKNENTAPDGDNKIKGLMLTLHKDFINSYSRDYAKLSDFLSGIGGNCEAQSKLIYSTFTNAKVSPNSPQLFAAQLFSDHIQLVTYNPESKEVWNPMTGDREIGTRTSLYHPLIMVHGFLEKQGAKAPLKPKDLLIAKGTGKPPANPFKIFNFGRTNTPLSLPIEIIPEDENGTTEIPEFTTIAPPKDNPGPPRNVEKASASEPKQKKGWIRSIFGGGGGGSRGGNSSADSSSKGEGWLRGDGSSSGKRTKDSNKIFYTTGMADPKTPAEKKKKEILDKKGFVFESGTQMLVFKDVETSRKFSEIYHVDVPTEKKAEFLTDLGEAALNRVLESPGMKNARKVFLEPDYAAKLTDQEITDAVQAIKDYVLLIKATREDARGLSDYYGKWEPPTPKDPEFKGFLFMTLSSSDGTEAKKDFYSEVSQAKIKQLDRDAEGFKARIKNESKAFLKLLDAMSPEERTRFIRFATEVSDHSGLTLQHEELKQRYGGFPDPVLEPLSDLFFKYSVEILEVKKGHRAKAEVPASHGVFFVQEKDLSPATLENLRLTREAAAQKGSKARVGKNESEARKPLDSFDLDRPETDWDLYFRLVFATKPLDPTDRQVLNWHQNQSEEFQKFNKDGKWDDDFLNQVLPNFYKFTYGPEVRLYPSPSGLWVPRHIAKVMQDIAHRQLKDPAHSLLAHLLLTEGLINEATLRQALEDYSRQLDEALKAHPDDAQQ